MFIVDPLEFVSESHRIRLREAAGYRVAAARAKPVRRRRRRLSLGLHLPRHAA